MVLDKDTDKIDFKKAEPCFIFNDGEEARGLATIDDTLFYAAIYKCVWPAQKIYSMNALAENYGVYPLKILFFANADRLIEYPSLIMNPCLDLLLLDIVFFL